MNSDDAKRGRQNLYLLDRFNVSDEAYHKLAMTSSDVPRAYKIEKLRTEINSDIELGKTPGSSKGVSISFVNRLEAKVQHMVSWFFRSVQYPPYNACILLILYSQQIQKYTDSVQADSEVPRFSSSIWKGECFALSKNGKCTNAVTTRSKSMGKSCYRYTRVLH